ncbi:DUF5318 family protein [Haloechinothrix sp. LS1_15]|uniref:DUF5318 family protein n=1 Tax=Haloechinothrix sp. LS1_15 TaxID=2652248 RepID=UPI0029448B84|nr:DUF5318 family protein [Haloechinothrix sp. LS1_15]MDV6011030.1 DUF5318 domain-containing protein [Haloechinothrix sp. LS1_15]
MRTQRQIVDYALRKRALLRQFRTGQVSREEVCDAGTYLLRAAEFHGEAVEHPCPICSKHRMCLVAWVFGAQLGQASGSARQPDELDRMAELFSEFTVYVVEVCRMCRWNHVALSYVLGTGDQGPRRSRAQQAAAP